MKSAIILSIFITSVAVLGDLNAFVNGNVVHNNRSLVNIFSDNDQHQDFPRVSLYGCVA